MRSIWIALAIAACATGCKKKSEEAATKVADPSAPLPPSKPLPPAKDGAVYISIYYGGVARLDPEGWKVIGKPADSVQIQVGADGTLWAWTGSAVWRFDGTTFVDVTGKTGNTKVSRMAGAADGTLWVIADGEVRRLANETWTTIPLPGGDPPRGIAADADGIWVFTLDRTYRHTAGEWVAHDVPGVTGQQADVMDIGARGRDAYLVTNSNVMAFENGAWRQVASHAKMGHWASIIPGPAGRFALATATGDRFLGDTAHGTRALRAFDSKPFGVNAGNVSIGAIDDRGRTWAGIRDGVAVVDPSGKLLKHWARADSPAIIGEVNNVAVVGGGPSHLEAGERMVGKVTGKVEGSAAGMTVRACSQGQPEYDKEPCDGVGNARSTTTIEGGKFTFDGVTIGPMYFWVKRGNRWRGASSSTPCCTQLTPDGTVDVGTLTLQ